jgi:hypothetical protein
MSPKWLYALLVSFMHAICPVHQFLLDLFALMKTIKHETSHYVACKPLILFSLFYFQILSSFHPEIHFSFIILLGLDTIFHTFIKKTCLRRFTSVPIG